jgi:catechol 2,3-dioxygenase-like lactoylglutathione lyase family enzyme
MTLQKMYTSLLTADLQAAEAWYTKLLGQGRGRHRGDYSTLAQVRDPDGNLITLATPPRRPFPRA